MSRENVEAMRRALDAYSAGDLAALREFYEPTAVMYHLDGWPEPGPSFGRDAVLQEFARLQEAWQGGSERLEVLGDFVEISNHVLMRLRWRVSARGPDTTMEFTMVCTFRKGKIITIQYFWDHDEALEAVGLRD
jgi:ketosteroid isomerase-like protein